MRMMRALIAGLILVASVCTRAEESLPLETPRHLEFAVTSGTWMSVDVSPDGRTVIFDLLGDLYALDLGSTDARRLTAGIAFDSQPTWSPDGRWIAFLSDRSGAENLWVMRADGSSARALSFLDHHDTFISPAWSADGQSVYVSRHLEALNASEVWRFNFTQPAGGAIVLPIRADKNTPREQWRSVLGVVPAADNQTLYFAAHVGDSDYDQVPEWTVRRRNLVTDAEETLVSAPRSPRPDLNLGSAFRPAQSPDGRLLVYATRHDGRTGLRALDLRTREDRWLLYPVQQDALQAFSSQDLLPRYDFMPDGRSLLLARDGKLQQLDVSSGQLRDIPFRAQVALDIGPSLRVPIQQETGPVRARLIQGPVQSPDGRRLAFSALGSVFVMPLDGRSAPVRLNQQAETQFQPSWSPDGRELTYVTWTAIGAGHVFVARVDGRKAPRRLTDVAAFYTNPTFAPDGASVLVVRSSNDVRMHSYMEYGSLRQAELVSLPVRGGASTVLTQGNIGGRPQFVGQRVYLNFDDGLNSLAADGSDRRLELRVMGPAFYFTEGPAPADDLKISPDGRWALAQITQQLHLVAMPPVGVPPGERTVDLLQPSASHRRITTVGADFFEWADGGQTVTWAIGSTYLRQSRASLETRAGTASSSESGALAESAVQTFEARVEVPRDTPRGALLLRGATAITMQGPAANPVVIENADVLVVDDRIAGIGARGSVRLPSEVTIRDVAGQFILPGFIDAHDHVADIRRGILDLASWGPLANLAWGVTTAFDPSPLSIDMLAYEDLLDAGLMTGSRIHSTGPALFSFNQFRSRAEVRSVLTRYARHYRVRNLKQYRTGSRKVRQWVAQEARALGLQPTSEGALSLKLDISQITDGFAGTEHALPAVPLGEDVVQLLARSGVSYTPTLLIANGGPGAQDFYVARTAPHDDAKLNRFTPHFAIDAKTLKRSWRDPREYLFPRLAADVAVVQRAGGLVAAGSHGEMPGLGLHWELQAYVSGGMRPIEALHAATFGSAAAIGREAQFGSLESGKYADLLILSRDPRTDITNTLSLTHVLKNGRLYAADTLDEEWPRKRALPDLWFWKDVPGAVHQTTTAAPTQPGSH